VTRPVQAAAVVLAGGSSHRFGGGEKTDAPLGGRSVLEHVLAGLPAGVTAVVVGPRRALDGVRWVREEPAGGGPAAALAAGCAAVPAGTAVVLALAGDQPFGGSAVPRLLAALASGDADAAVGVDPAGKRQPLLAAYRLAKLQSALGPEPAGRSMRSVLAGLRVVQVAVSADETLDVDTPEDLAAARRALLAMVSHGSRPVNGPNP
jgi:molybdopterin-guanine dinucleotide biosynthesis protein A